MQKEVTEIHEELGVISRAKRIIENLPVFLVCGDTHSTGSSRDSTSYLPLFQYLKDPLRNVGWMLAFLLPANKHDFPCRSSAEYTSGTV